MEIGHVHLHVSDTDRAVRFYEEALGAKEAFRVGLLVFLNVPGERAVIVVDGRPDGARNPVHFGLTLAEETQRDATVESVTRAGGRIIERGEHAPGIPYAYVSDPDGNVFEL